MFESFGVFDIVESDDWEGLKYGTCANYAMVAKAFKSSQRCELLSFSHVRGDV